MTAGLDGFRKAVEELTNHLWATSSENTGVEPKHWRGIEYADGFEDATAEAVDALRLILEAHP